MVGPIPYVGSYCYTLHSNQIPRDFVAFLSWSMYELASVMVGSEMSSSYRLRYLRIAWSKHAWGFIISSSELYVMPLSSSTTVRYITSVNI